MPYDHLEELGARRHEKVAMYLTFENAVGLVAGALPAYIALGNAPGLIRILVTVVCGALGVIMTIDIAGMPTYARLLWRIRGLIRVRLRPTVIQPEDLTGTPVQASSGQARALRVGGTIQLARGPVVQPIAIRATGPRVARTGQRSPAPQPVAQVRDLPVSPVLTETATVVQPARAEEVFV